MSALDLRIAELIKKDRGEFDRLALELFARQYELNEPYRHLCDATGSVPGTVEDWLQIPAAPSSAFKRFDLSCARAEGCRTVFHSSGTTIGNPSRHFMDDIAQSLYETSLLAGWRRVLPAVLPVWGLMPSPDQAPNSSLSFMARALMSAPQFFWNDGGDGSRFADAVDALQTPVVVFGSAIAWAALFERVRRPLPLPSGSWVVETGGFKGRHVQVEPSRLYDLFVERLNVPAEQCVAEYGMSEMASQFYAVGPPTEDRAFKGPPWLRTRVIDPIRGKDAEHGLLVHYDLANWNSVMAIETEDVGTRMADGFVLHGRAPGSDLRGCSLTAERIDLAHPHRP